MTLPNAQIKISFEDCSPDSQALFPRIIFKFEIIYTYSGTDNQPVALSDFVINLRIKSENNIYLIGNILVGNPYLKLYPSNTSILETYLDLDFYRLSQIERLREGKDVQLQVIGTFYVETGQTGNKQQNQFYFDLRIPKSDWVEKILSEVGFKNVSLLEIPKFHSEEFKGVIKWVDSAWKLYMMGEYDKVLGDCRKALEGLSTLIKNKGFEKTVVEKEEKRNIPDWDKYLDNKDLGDIIGSIYQKMIGFTVHGAHFGKGINREDADLALMITHSLINFAIKKFPT